MKKLIAITGLLILSACAQAQNSKVDDKAPATEVTLSGKTDTAIFAGGCFWCIESDYEKLPGVIEAVAGYAGGVTIDPTYKEVTYADTGHFEVIEVTYDPTILSYNDLLDYFWVHVDPTDPHGQFCDKGSSYRTAIFARPDQIDAARKSKTDIIRTKPFSADIVTPVLEAATFYRAEEYHQDYYKKNPDHYNRYRTGCRRDARIRQLWGK